MHKNQENWFDGMTGNRVPINSVYATCTQQSVVMLGETHNRMDHHEWQLSIINGIHKSKKEIAIGFEMLPKNTQSVLDLWASGSLSDEEFVTESDWNNVWGFDFALYLPLFHFCKEHAIPMIGLNCNRQLVRDIGKHGWDGVDKECREDLTPAKTALSKYRKYLFEVTGGKRPDRQAKSSDDPAFDRFVRAQQVWDRAFACNLAEFHKQNPSTLLIGIIGSGHLDYGLGTPFQLEDLGIKNHTTLLPADDSEHTQGIADYICHLPE